MKAKTFDGDQIVEVEVLSAPNDDGLCKVKSNGRILVRHVNRLDPLDEETKNFLKN